MVATSKMLPPRPSEGGHWYTLGGEPCYEVLGKNGMRAATLRDARIMKLVPGVSSILALEAKPMLEAWKINQALMSALTLPRNPGESDDDFIERARADSNEQARKARDRGIAIHAALQGSFEGKPVTAEDLPYVTPVRAWLAQRYGLDGHVAEQSFASPMGYGGKADLSNISIPLVIDFKVKEFDENKSAKELAWPEHCMQLAAYRAGLAIPTADCANIFVSSKVPGLIQVREWDEEELTSNWEAFKCLLRLWQLRKSYIPTFNAEAA